MGNSPPKRASISRELERFTTPTGLYPSCPWDTRMIRRLILEKKIAPRFPGREVKESCSTQECPICFMFYPGALNVTSCCKKPICTECYLQLKPPRKAVCCPFCTRENFTVKYTAPAVINLSSIYTDTTYHPSSDEASAEEEMQDGDVTPPVLQHLASVEDRQRLRDDLRSQLNLTDQPITTPLDPPPLSHLSRPSSTNFIITSAEDAALLAEPRYIIASAEHAARLEEMMLMEAIRRSMRDLNVTKDDENEDEDDEAEYHVHDDDTGESDTLRPSQVMVQERAPPLARRPSSNPIDDHVSERRESASWIPFSE